MCKYYASTDLLQEYLPIPPDAGEEQPKFQFSVVECILFIFHTMCKFVPEFLTGDDSTTRLKDLRKRYISLAFLKSAIYTIESRGI